MFDYGSYALVALSLLALAVLIFVVPTLSRNRTYRIATFFAAANVGIVTGALFFTVLAITGSLFPDRELLNFFYFFLPTSYLPSLLIGSTIVARYVVDARTKARAICFGALAVGRSRSASTMSSPSFFRVPSGSSCSCTRRAFSGSSPSAGTSGNWSRAFSMLSATRRSF